MLRQWSRAALPPTPQLRYWRRDEAFADMIWFFCEPFPACHICRRRRFRSYTALSFVHTPPARAILPYIPPLQITFRDASTFQVFAIVAFTPFSRPPDMVYATRGELPGGYYLAAPQSMR